MRGVLYKNNITFLLITYVSISLIFQDFLDMGADYKVAAGIVYENTINFNIN